MPNSTLGCLRGARRELGRFAQTQPVLAAAGGRLLYIADIGLGFLSTVRADGGPRVHPICPLLTLTGLYGLIVPGPKLADLRRDGATRSPARPTRHRGRMTPST